MIVVIAERVEDIRDNVDAAHANLAAILDPADQGRGLGYARVCIAAPVARHEGVAVLVGDAAVGTAPDPVQILVRDAKGLDPAGPTLCVRRKALPVLVQVDPVAGRARVLRRLGVPANEQDTLPPSPEASDVDVGRVPEPAHGQAKDRAPGGPSRSFADDDGVRPTDPREPARNRGSRG